MSGLVRGAIQRAVPKHPHKPGSHLLGARTLWRQHWRKPASLERPDEPSVGDELLAVIKAWDNGYEFVEPTASDEVPTPVRHRIYRPTRAAYSYGPR